MKNKSILGYWLLLCLMSLAACKDSNNALIFEKEELKSKIVLRDKYTEVKDTIVKGDVYLSLNREAKPYLYKVETNANGEFTLQYLPQIPKKGDSCYVVGKYTGSNKIEYTGAKTDQGFAGDLILSPIYPRGKLKVTYYQTLPADLTKPDVTNRINAAEVYLFASKEQAETVSLASVAKGQLAKKTTNERGVAFFYDLGIFRYYVVGKTTDSHGKTVFSEIIEANVSSDKTDTVTVVTVSLISQINKSLTVTVKQPGVNGAPLAGVEIYLFKDDTKTGTLSATNGPIGFEKQLTTLVDGQAKFDDLTEKEYYVGLRFKRSDGVIYTDPAKKIELVTVKNNLNRTIALLNVPFKVKVTDVNNEPVNKATVYLFKNKSQAQSMMDPGGPVGFFKQVTTEANGEAVFSDVFDGSVYIGVSVPTIDGKGRPILHSDPVKIEENLVFSFP
jgi:hypothetical protein